jgi:hypothetical protein
MYLARKVNAPSWDAKQDVVGDLSGDLAREVQTKRNKLSFWRCADATEIGDAVLALVTAPESTPDELYVVLLPEEEVRSIGAELEPSKGNTVVETLRERHVDATNLSFGRLHELARRIAARVRGGEEDCQLFTKDDVIRLITDAAGNGRLETQKLSKATNEELGRRLTSFLRTRAT